MGRGLGLGENEGTGYSATQVHYEPSTGLKGRGWKVRGMVISNKL